MFISFSVCGRTRGGDTLIDVFPSHRTITVSTRLGDQIQSGKSPFLFASTVHESLFDKNLIVCNHTFGKYNRFLFTGRTILTENNLQSAAALIDRSFKSADVVS
ncbi:hypothetical protein F2Q70_00043734 [Brassica cretica]|uniref:Uncharacterized protein n=2 Tax=Brassica cretica TaxID=69181 RepID=A0A8S9KM61_BRACR|nr:hypothetical protein F2Q70_00043734 [Brassica cretica]KAF2607686.1 hypothetical protein F2Q68_00044744 [Brassica cretica]KAF3516246.1 hypothetical protein DY000_02061100 [Brassica cretica]KAF3524334.1 hypothetical protein F2Q69_00048719 [Brassica cretica]